MARVTQLLFEFTVDIANRDTAPNFRSRSRHDSEAVKQAFETPLPKARPRLGISWKAMTEADDTNSAEQQDAGVVVAQVTRGGAADRAGISVGDRILSFGGAPTTVDSLVSQVLRSGSTVEVQMRKKGVVELEKINVRLDGNPIRLGISWREDEAEPGAITIARVVPGSPAHKAGVRLLDRVYKLDGQAFHNGSEFLERARYVDFPCSLLIDREGVLQEVEIKSLSHIPASTAPDADQ